MATISDAWTLYKGDVSTSFSISTGVTAMDSMLEGGLSAGRVYEMFGPPGAGKTQFALTVAANVMREGGNVLYFDTKRDFYVRRLLQILGEPYTENVSEEASILDQIRIKKIPELSALIESLGYWCSVLDKTSPDVDYEHLSATVFSSRSSPRLTTTGPFWESLRLLVVDNIAYPTMDYFDGKEDNLKTAFGFVSQIIDLLRRLATEHRLCVLVINTAASKFPVSASGDSEEALACLKPSLGKIFSRAADVRVLVERPNPEADARKITLHSFLRRTPRGSSCYATISSSGWTNCDA